MFVRDAEGEPVELIGMLFDVTDLHGALEARAESERHLRTVIDNIPGMVYRSQAVAPWSDEFIAGGDVSLTGYTVEELTAPDFRWDQVMHPEDVPRLEEASRIGAETGRGQAEYRIRAKDGAERWLLDRFTFLKDEHGVPMAQEGILVDVTEQHRIEDELRASRSELELHARIATIFLTAPPDRMFTEALGAIRDALGARWGFFGYLDADGALVAPSRGRGGLGRLPGRRQADAVPAGGVERQHLVARHPHADAPSCSRARARCPRATCPSGAPWRRPSCTARRASACSSSRSARRPSARRTCACWRTSPRPSRPCCTSGASGWSRSPRARRPSGRCASPSSATARCTTAHPSACSCTTPT